MCLLVALVPCLLGHGLIESDVDADQKFIYFIGKEMPPSEFLSNGYR